MSQARMGLNPSKLRAPKGTGKCVTHIYDKVSCHEAAAVRIQRFAPAAGGGPTSAGGDSAGFALLYWGSFSVLTPCSSIWCPPSNRC